MRRLRQRVPCKDVDLINLKLPATCLCFFEGDCFGLIFS